MKMIDLNKEYTTRNNLQVKLYDIVTADNQTYPVMGSYYDDCNKCWVICAWKLDGRHGSNDSMFDLIEKPAKQEFAKDQLVWVWNDNGAKRIRFFSGYENNKFRVFSEGEDSTTTVFTTPYDNCEPYQPTSKPLEEGELVVVWDDDGDNYVNYSNKYAIRRLHTIKGSKFDCFNQEGRYDTERNIWDNCVRLSEFKL